jgi:hypothetical protein
MLCLWPLLGNATVCLLKLLSRSCKLDRLPLWNNCKGNWYSFASTRLSAIVPENPWSGPELVVCKTTDLFLESQNRVFVKRYIYGSDQWAAAQLQRVSNQWVARGGRFHSNQFKTTFYLPAIMECRPCLSAQDTGSTYRKNLSLIWNVFWRVIEWLREIKMADYWGTTLL